MAIMLVLTLFRHVRSCSRIDSRYTLIFNEVTLVCYLVSCEDVSWFCTSCTSMWSDLLLTLLASRNRVPSMLAPPSLHTPNIFPFCFFNQQVKINTPLLVCSICTYQVLIFLFFFAPFLCSVSFVAVACCVRASVCMPVGVSVDRSVGWSVGGSYCQCFAMQTVCTVSCNCHNCYNNANQESMRMQAINGVLERNPAAFDAKFKETEVR